MKHSMGTHVPAADLAACAHQLLFSQQQCWGGPVIKELLGYGADLFNGNQSFSRPAYLVSSLTLGSHGLSACHIC